MDTIEWIVWSIYEHAYLSNLGHTWKKYNDIPEEYHSLVKDIPVTTRKSVRGNKPIK
jgi:hypothetical protein